jgi:hypothetical protein
MSLTQIYSGEGKTLYWDDEVYAYRITTGTLDTIYWPENVPAQREGLETELARAMYDHFTGVFPPEEQARFRGRNS